MISPGGLVLVVACILGFCNFANTCRPFNIRKIVEPKTCTGPPVIEGNAMTNVTRSPGQKASFECLIDHSCLVSVIKWYHVNPDNTSSKLIKTAKSPGDPHVYFIEKVTPEDEGTYSCVAENVIGKTAVVAYLTINSCSILTPSVQLLLPLLLFSSRLLISSPT